MGNRAAIVLSALLVFGAVPEFGAKPVLEQVGEFVVPEANQGVGVDANHFYAVDNPTIGKYDKKTGKLVKKWQGDKRGPILHLERDGDGWQALRGAFQCVGSLPAGRHLRNHSCDREGKGRGWRP